MKPKIIQEMLKEVSRSHARQTELILYWQASIQSHTAQLTEDFHQWETLQILRAQEAQENAETDLQNILAEVGQAQRDLGVLKKTLRGKISPEMKAHLGRTISKLEMELCWTNDAVKTKRWQLHEARKKPNLTHAAYVAAQANLRDLLRRAEIELVSAQQEKAKAKQLRKEIKALFN